MLARLRTLRGASLALSLPHQPHGFWLSYWCNPSCNHTPCRYESGVFTCTQPKTELMAMVSNSFPDGLHNAAFPSRSFNRNRHSLADHGRFIHGRLVARAGIKSPKMIPVLLGCLADVQARWVFSVLVLLMKPFSRPSRLVILL